MGRARGGVVPQQSFWTGREQRQRTSALTCDDNVYVARKFTRLCRTGLPRRGKDRRAARAKGARGTRAANATLVTGAAKVPGPRRAADTKGEANEVTKGEALHPQEEVPTEGERGEALCHAPIKGEACVKRG